MGLDAAGTSVCATSTGRPIPASAKASTPESPQSIRQITLMSARNPADLFGMPNDPLIIVFHW